jgi:hypothetical protein
MPTTSRPAGPDIDAMLRLTELGDYATALAIRAVTELGIPDLLAGGPRPVEELATACGAHPVPLYRALRALACQGVFAEEPVRVFALTPVSDLLRADHPYSMRTHYQLMIEDVQAWARIDYTLRTADAWSFELVHGESYWKYLESHPDYRAKFEATMAGMTRHELDAILPRYPWRRVNTLVDVGGGTGQMIAGLLRANPHLRGVMFDQPHVAPHARPLLEAEGVADRCEIVSGDFFQSVPEGGDAYLLKRVLYDFSDEEAVTILSNVRRAMRPGGRVLTLDGIIRPDQDLDVAKLHDLFILPLGPGHCRTRAEMAALFERSGLELTRLIATPIFPLVEAKAAPAPTA